MEPHQTCATCSHWREFGGFRRPEGLHGREDEWGHCIKGAFDWSRDDGSEVDPASTAVAYDDDEHYSARLLTHATHGCRMWSPKPA